MILNEAQKKAIEILDGSLCLLAGAGTGKTQTLITRIEALIKHRKIFPSRILALTFTNKAAGELKNRLINKGIKGVSAMTFHSLAAFLLRQFWTEDFKIIDSQEQDKILKTILKEEQWKEIEEVKLEIEKYILCHPERFCHSSDRKSKDPLNSTGENYSTPPCSAEQLKEIIIQYEKTLTENNALDFTGLLTQLLQLWQGQPEVLSACQNKYQYILVDEYQDVNQLQIAIMQKLAEKHGNLCVVGDPDQTIYSWRGARSQTMAEFQKIYPESALITLDLNYRSPPRILQGAENLIQHNSARLPKSLKAIKTDPAEINFWLSQNEEEQEEKILYILEQYLGSSSSMVLADSLDTEKDHQFRSLAEIAILYRTQVLGEKMTALLTRKGYPCQLSSPKNFWDKPEITAFLNGLKLFIHPEIIIKLNLTGSSLSAFVNTQLENYFSNNKLSLTKITRLQQLLSLAVSFDDLPLPEALEQFLLSLETKQEADYVLPADKINLLTFHAAKGLEFPIVFIIGLEEDHLPLKKLKDDPYFLEEERRLFYVGLTRATSEIHLFSCQKTGEKTYSPSRFISEIGLDHLKNNNLPFSRQQKAKKRTLKKDQLKLF